MKVEVEKITIKKIATQSASVLNVVDGIYTHMGVSYPVDRELLSSMVRLIENVCIIYPQSVPTYSIELDYGHYKKAYLIDPGHNRAVENIQRKLQGYSI